MIPEIASLGEPRKIVEILEAIGRKIDLRRLERAVLDELSKALLHKLMNGEFWVGELRLTDFRRRPNGNDNYQRPSADIPRQVW